MNTPSISLAQLSDRALLDEVRRRADRERECTVDLIASLMELDMRRLYLGEGCSSQILRLSEHGAYGRIEVARAARRFPTILDLLSDGSLTLTTAGLLSPVLTEENHRGVFEAARRKSKREVEHLIAGLRPQPAVPATVRKLPPRPAMTSPVTPLRAAGGALATPPQVAEHLEPAVPARRPVEIELRCRAHNVYEAEVYFRPRQLRVQGNGRRVPVRVTRVTVDMDTGPICA